MWRIEQNKEELAARPVKSLEEDPGENINRLWSEVCSCPTSKAAWLEY